MLLGKGGVLVAASRDDGAKMAFRIRTKPRMPKGSIQMSEENDTAVNSKKQTPIAISQEISTANYPQESNP
jgi:hypothetical protein